MTETAPAWHLYLVRTRLGTLYTGIATDVERRLAEHGGAAGAKYLRAKGPFVLAYRARVGDRGLALRLERRVKGLSRAEKEDIIARRPGPAALLRQVGLEGA